MGRSYQVSSNDSRNYEPIGNSGVLTNGTIIDIAHEYDWTLSPQNSRKDVPIMELKEYQQTTGQLVASMSFFTRQFERALAPGADIMDNVWNIAAERDKNPLESYQQKYFGQPTGFSYYLPYLNQTNINRVNGFGDDNSLSKLSTKLKSVPGVGTILDKVTGFVDAGIAIANTMMPGQVKFEFPQSWTSTNVESFSLSFELFNTKSLDSAKKNREFCQIFSHQNTPSRRNISIMDPPVIYSMYIAGIVNLPACYVSSLTITNLGNTRQVVFDGVTRIIPEAYRIVATFTSLFLPSRNLMQETDEGRRVQIISSRAYKDRLVQDQLTKLLNKNDATKPPKGIPVAEVVTDAPIDSVGTGGPGSATLPRVEPPLPPPDRTNNQGSSLFPTSGGENLNQNVTTSSNETSTQFFGQFGPNLPPDQDITLTPIPTPTPTPTLTPTPWWLGMRPNPARK